MPTYVPLVISNIPMGYPADLAPNWHTNQVENSSRSTHAADRQSAVLLLIRMK
jgi:hypothetical protein